MDSLTEQRQAMIERHLKARGIRDPNVLAAMQEVPREEFISRDLVEFAYDDAPLPIEEEQTISQPYIVALMAQLLNIQPGDRVLDVGTGSGYAAAVMSRIAESVFTVERHKVLAESARQRFRAMGFDNIEVLHGDGTRGWPEHAPFDGINVAAGGTEVPQALQDQLAEGGGLIIPVDADARGQRLSLLSKCQGRMQSQSLGWVRFVPLISEPEQPTDPMPDESVDANLITPDSPSRHRETVGRIRQAAEPFTDIEGADLDGLLNRIGNCRVLLLGESTHGTSEFYRMRARITRELVEKKGFNIVAVEADWPDAAHVHRVIRGIDAPTPPERPFNRFPTWMWRNREVQALVRWLKQNNQSIADEQHRVGFYGLDLYSLFASAEAVVDYLEGVDPDLARLAIRRYGCLSPYEQDPAAYAAAAMSGRYADCADDVVQVLTRLLEHEMQLTEKDGDRFHDAVHNARLVANAEKYYRTMYLGARASWNQRDSHMFETLQALLGKHPDNKAVVWAHNSHLGNAGATEMAARGEHNIGQLVKRAYGDQAYAIGFSTDHGSVAAADDWGGPMQVKQIRPGMEDSIERLFHETGIERFLLPLRGPPHSRHSELYTDLAAIRLQRAIGVIYRPQTELQSHYFQASLARQFDELIWFDASSAVQPLDKDTGDPDKVPDTFPFGL